MKATGKIIIEEGLELNNPTLDVKSIYVECLFTDENGNKHNRLIELDVDLSVLGNELKGSFERNETINKFG